MVSLRTPVALYVLALAVRAALFGIFPDPAYHDSSYYVDVARSIAAGHGFTVDFVWIFAEVGGKIPANNSSKYSRKTFSIGSDVEFGTHPRSSKGKR